AVAIVTIHKSKGLEYPIVFLPYLWAGTRSIDKSGPAVFHDPLNQDELIFDLGSEDIDRARELMALEQETEEMRLLYVALTRASAMCRIYWGGFAGAERSALGKLLHPSGCKEDAAMAQDLEKLCDQVPSCIEVTVPAAGYAQDKFSQSDEILIQPLAPRVMKRKVKSNWRISSYSALISGQNVHFEENQTPENWEPEPQTTLLNQTGSDEPVLLETFPKGARAGDFFHGVLEDIDFSDQTMIEPAVIRNLDKFGLTGTGSDHLVCDALRDIISSSLNPEDGTEFRLEDITQENRFTELEFSFSLDQFNYREMAGLFAGFNETADYAARLSGMDIPVFKGFLKGFVDLVVRHDNKWYILDYKSNYLGPEYKDYQGQNVNEAMVSHDYILQYHLYLAALDRYLALRLPGYDYNVHFGGVFYLFIRGMKPDLDTGIYYHKPSSMFMDKFRKIL
ncbi:MAG: PD-(D/E)XK nuclease family protein, partial [Desulfobacterales bacterium]|nr:PD-(D/E)XK nuclease family protein [Desulfobacterales bacterium]